MNGVESSVDIPGAVGLIWFSVKEGKEAFEKADGKECACHDEGAD